jgi:biopolymer transport protein ExbD
MAISMGSRSGRRKTVAEINITPFTDVCLVLLIIFMVSASFMGTQRGLDVKLPAPSNDMQQDNRPQRDITIVITNAGAITLEVTNTQGKPEVSPVSADQLISAISSDASRYKIKSVTVKPERGVVYDNVIRVMDSVKEAGIDYMALAVQQQPVTAPAGTGATPTSHGAAGASVHASRAGSSTGV